MTFTLPDANTTRLNPVDEATPFPGFGTTDVSHASQTVPGGAGLVDHDVVRATVHLHEVLGGAQGSLALDAPPIA